MPEMQFDFDGLIQLLAKNLYSEKKIFIRELIQNAHDSIHRRKALEKDGYYGRIDIDSRPRDLEITFRDNGTGMNRDELHDYLSNIGKSLTREEQGNVEGLIGQFGIGFLSAFVVAEQVEVRTRKFDETRGWLWSNSGSKEYQLTECQIDAPGTTVTVFLQGEEDRGVIYEESVLEVIRRYADMLTVPIYFSGSSSSINTMHMPWEQEGKSLKELKFDCEVYLLKTMKENVLETIPVQLRGEVNASGVLYLTKVRVINAAAPRNVRVFQNRMFLCENMPEILPEWASFVNGVINTPDLTPTAARDNFIRNAAAQRLQEALGDLIISHLEQLQQSDSERFSQILRYHNWGIKSACLYYPEFFAKFVHLLEWRTNSGIQETHGGDFKPVWRTLPEILSRLPESPGEPQPLPCFTDYNSANQYFQMADAAGTLVVDASWWFEGELLEDYSRLDGVTVRLIHVDREEDPNVFRRLEDEQESQQLDRLAEVMANFPRPGGYGKMRVEARCFDPPELAAVVRSSERSRAQITAEEIIYDPTADEEIREMAEQMVHMSRGASLKLVINATNPLIRKLARQELKNRKLVPIMLGVFNNALLYNQELLTTTNARILHDQFHELLEHNLDFLEMQASVEAERNELARQRERLERQQGPRPQHRIFFMITPFADQYSPLINDIREVIEDRWGCQLYVASDLQKKDRIFDNVRAHIDQADAFIAEISEANPNVMFELGAVRFDYHSRPVLLLHRGSENGERIELPSDLHGMIYIDYGRRGQRPMADYLEQQMQSHADIQALLDDTRRSRFLSPRRLRTISCLDIPEEIFKRLSTRFPTNAAWKYLTEEDLKPHLGEYSRFAPMLLQILQEQQQA